VIKCISISLPSGADSQGLAATAVFQAADAAGSTVLQAAAKRELARANFNEHLLQAVVPGHFNENGELYLPNTVYNIEFDRANIDEKMFLYSVEWNLTSERGSFSVLSFCNLNTIVSDAAV
jgi:prophage tail gpP-like protein